jgi:hypothetical protein
MNKTAYSTLINDNDDIIELKGGTLSRSSGEYVSVRQLTEIVPNDPVKLKDIDNNAIYEMFPNASGVNKEELMINKIGLCCMTKPYAAQKMMDIVRKYIDPEKSTMINATCCIGGDLLNMCIYFKKTYGYEICDTQFSILKHNVKIYGYENLVELFNEDYTKFINEQESDLVLIDPPWGGINYKEQRCINTKLGSYSMDKLVKRINTKIIALKLPKNQYMKRLRKLNPDIYKINNYQLLIFQKK